MIEVSVGVDPEFDEETEIGRMNGQFWVRMVLIPDDESVPGVITAREVLESPFRHRTREEAQIECLKWAEATGATPYHVYPDGKNDEGMPQPKWEKILRAAPMPGHGPV